MSLDAEDPVLRVKGLVLVALVLPELDADVVRRGLGLGVFTLGAPLADFLPGGVGRVIPC